ncbi:MAG TPA: hypothetical protein VNJ07_00860 [Chitinophagales bacterium]|nr:hypothetical protein [Chitinophagales bacterium]
MIISEIELFEALSQQLGAEKAKTLVKYVEAKVDKRMEENTSVFATKEDLARLEGKLTVKLTETKAEIIKWMFIFWVGSVGVLSGIMFAMLNAYLK